jgi:hypothetical protein
MVFLGILASVGGVTILAIVLKVFSSEDETQLWEVKERKDGEIIH